MESIDNKAGAFLARHAFVVPHGEVHSIVDGMVRYMQSSAMLPTHLTPPLCVPEAGDVIVIDAGGTNFRSCVVHFGGEKSGSQTAHGSTTAMAEVSDMRKCAMPGIEREYTAEEFYGAFADRIDYLKGRAGTICLCFSYAVRMLPNGDGRVVQFSKEIKARAACGTLLGASLNAALQARGWGKVRIVIVNDTTAALIAGKLFGKSAMRPASYAAFILGTGMNSAFTDSAGQVVVTEIGAYNDLPMSDFDRQVDDASATPNAYILEKQCGGAYLGHLAAAMLRVAVAEGVLAEGLLARCEVGSTADIDRILYAPFDAVDNSGEREVVFALLDAAVARAAVLSAAAIAASVVATGRGTSALHPVRVECNGTTFNKTYRLRQRVEAVLEAELCVRRGLHWELCCVENDITLGTAAASGVRGDNLQ